MASASPPPRFRLLASKPGPDAPASSLTPKTGRDAPHLRFAQQRLNAVVSQLGRATEAPLPALPPPPPSAARSTDGAASSWTTVKGKRRAGGAEMVVRAEVDDEHLRDRNLVRRARVTFEALRGVYLRQDRKRADLLAMSTMRSRGLCLHRNVRVVGPVPGVLVGDVFAYRAELCVVGLHNHPQAGIGFLPASRVSEGHSVATSIVSSGGYLDDHDSGDVLVYTGSGGRQHHRVEHDADQAFERGNLALAYSCKYGVDVRVVRCHDCAASPSGKLYVYDGLYKVVSSTYGPGKSGYDVCKFRLERLPGQEELGSRTWHYAGELKGALGSKIRPREYITPDLSKGKETIRIPVFNNVDQDSSPLDFDYVARRHDLTLNPKPAKGGCHCGTACSGSTSCACVRKNGGGQVYTVDGTLVRGRPVVHECGALCGCSAGCPNRATQRGMQHRLEVFRSTETEWGVRTLDLIQPGAFVCEFTGEVVAAVDSHSAGLVDWGGVVNPRMFPERWREWGDASASAALPEYERPQLPRLNGPGYVLDVSRRRNFAAYISHSAAPNVFVQCVSRGGENEARPHLMVFAMDTIPPMRELSIDYGID